MAVHPPSPAALSDQNVIHGNSEFVSGVHFCFEEKEEVGLWFVNSRLFCVVIAELTVSSAFAVLFREILLNQ